MNPGRVGAQTLPLSPLDPGVGIKDSTIEGILHYTSWWLNEMLNPALSTLIVDKVGAQPITSPIAVPDANRYPINPMEPRGHHIKLHVPCLYAWWMGKGSIPEEFNEQSVTVTMLYTYRTRGIGLMWVYNEVPSTEALLNRSGVLSAAADSIHMAFEMGYHEAYTPLGQANPQGDPWPAGTPLVVALGGIDRVGITLHQSTHGRFGIDDPNIAPEARPQSGRDYPALFAILRVQERVERINWGVPHDQASVVRIRGESARVETDGEPVIFMEREIDPPEDV
jgi:hypothetical protein